MTLPLFACMGTTHPKYRGSAWKRVHDDLRLSFNKGALLRHKGKRQRKRERSRAYKQCGAP